MNSKVNIQFIDLFPDCCLPDCTEQGEHKHILPKQQQILDSTAKYLYCQGGVGSSKSIAFAAKCVYLSVMIPENRGIVSRYNYDDLYDSSWRDIKDCIERIVQKGKIPAPEMSKKTQGDYTQITFANGSEIKAVQGKNWHRGLGASHGWFWVDDAMEALEEFFVGNETSAGLLSRLRLAHVHYDKVTHSKLNREHGSLHGMISTNPPPVGHWLHKLFGTTPGSHNIGHDTVEWIQTATYENPFVGADYAMGLMAVQDKMGHSKNVARRVIYGESIPAYGGIKVFPQFDHARHVAPLVFDASLPLVESYDFGFHHPAVVCSNLYKCEYGTNHYRTLSEIPDAFSLTVYKLYDDFVKPHNKSLYSDAKLILNAGDRAGYRASSSNKDKRGDMKILIDEYRLPFKHRVLDLANSLQYMRGLLDPKKPCRCGEEHISISPNCPVLIGALEGGYKYAKTRDGRASDKPIEDRYFADLACAWRYGAENYVKWGVPYEDRQVLAVQEVAKQKRVQRPWEWMEMSDKQIAEMLIR